MFKIIGHTREIEVRLLLDPYYKVNIEWGPPISADHVYWHLSNDNMLLMFGADRNSGLPASIATPIAASEYEPDRLFLVGSEKIYKGIPIFDVSRFIEEDRSVKKGTQTLLETGLSSMTVGTRQILIDFKSELEAISCIASERADFYADQSGFVTKIVCNMTDEEMATWKSYHLQL